MKTVLTNGCFDILHAGHVDFLWKCRGLGDRLVVAVNSDESVKKIKGASRPINNVADRVSVLRSLRMVDDVIVFNDTNVSRLLVEHAPDIWAKGGDYTIETLNESEVKSAESVGASIVIVPISKTISTTSILTRV